jgi:hypothetical protein
MAERSKFARRAVCGILAVLCAVLRCSAEEDPVKPRLPADSIPPEAVIDLAPRTSTGHSVMLVWTAPGDDAAIGAASRYDIRYSTTVIGTATWDTASCAANEPPPSAAGSRDTCIVTGLAPNTSYYFALKSADDRLNWSFLSNVVRGTTLAVPDTVPPAAVIDLAVSHRTAHELQLTWTAPGDDGSAGTAALYDIRYSTSPMSEASWISASQAALEPAPQHAGCREMFAVSGLEANTTYYLALKTADRELNVSALSNVLSDSTLACMFCWLPVGSGMGAEGAPGPEVDALAVHDGALVAGGRFTTAGGVPAANIAAWNGSAWSALGTGTSNTVRAITMHNGKLIAAEIPGPLSPTPLRSWDGGSWSPIEGMYLDTILALASYEEQLIVGGTFTIAGGVSAGAIAAWNGSYWMDLGGGMRGDSLSPARVYALAVYHGQLIAAGDFSVAGSFPADNIAAWNGVFWSPLGSGLNGGESPRVRALTVYNDELIAAGNFSSAGGDPAGNIAAWNGSVWSPLGSGVAGGTLPGVDALAVHDGMLVAGGGFTTAGGVPASCVAAWNGSGWAPVGTGMRGGSGSGVSAFTIFGERLIAGGDFTAAGDCETNAIAAWARW